MTTAIVSWDSLDTAVHQKVQEFYRDIWNDAVLNLVKEKESTQAAIQKAYTISKIEHKKMGLDFGFVNLKWDAHPEEDYDVSLVEIQAGLIDTSPISDDDVEGRNAINAIIKHMVYCEALGLIPVFSIHIDPFKPYLQGVRVFYKDDSGAKQSLLVDKFPFSRISTAIDPSLFPEVSDRNAKRVEATQKQKPLEQEKEDELYDWLRLQGIDVERQVKTSSKQFIDLWIPGKMMIEVKRGSISANDVCQCIDYASEYKLPIVLIGEKISGAASRGLKGFNKLCPKQKICFVSWDTAYDYLRGKLIINGDRQLNLGE